MEDHDDLVPIFNKQSELQPNIHQDFFLAHLIQSQDENNKTLVAEVNGTAVGMLSMTTNIQLEVALSTYQKLIF